MSKVMLALGSFIVGACCASIISFGIQTSTWAQVPAVGVPGAIPKANVSLGPQLKNVEIGGSFVQPLDGINCDGCTFDNAALTYGGGDFKLMHSSFRNGIRIRLTGAAANTVVLLGIVRAMSEPTRPVPPPAYKPPLLMQASISAPATLSFSTTP